jgi:uncharacterized OsmC-like protein
MTASIIYNGSLRCAATHLQSGAIVETDAPTDNMGKGERFSPTDLVCVALATCIITTIGIKAAEHDISVDNTKLEVAKYMVANPRRIGKIYVKVHFPIVPSEKMRIIFENLGKTCPVHRSIHPDVELQIEYHWGI